MRQVEVPHVVISNTPPPVNGNCRVEPITIRDRTSGASQHGYNIIPLRTFIGHQSSDWGKNQAAINRRKEAKRNNLAKHKHGRGR